MHTKGHPVKWKGVTYYLGELTQGVKTRFVQMYTETMTAQAALLYGGNLRMFRQFCRDLVAASAKDEGEDDQPEAAYWTATATQDVIDFLRSHKGAMCLYRLLLDADDEDFPEKELVAMAKERAADPTSDLCLAMKEIWRVADPKVQPGSLGLAGPPTESTPSSSTTPSA